MIRRCATTISWFSQTARCQLHLQEAEPWRRPGIRRMNVAVGTCSGLAGLLALASSFCQRPWLPALTRRLSHRQENPSTRRQGDRSVLHAAAPRGCRVACTGRVDGRRRRLLGRRRCKWLSCGMATLQVGSAWGSVVCCAGVTDSSSHRILFWLGTLAKSSRHVNSFSIHPTQ